MKLILFLALLSTTLALPTRNLEKVIKGIATSLKFENEVNDLFECLDSEPIESWSWFHSVLEKKKENKKEDVLLRLSAFITPVIDTFIKVYDCSKGDVEKVMEEIMLKSYYHEGLIQKFYKDIDKIKGNLDNIHGRWKNGTFEEMGKAIGEIIKDTFYD